MSGLRFRAVVPERGYDAELAVEAGRTLALVGPNGAGKSTTVDLIAGLLRAAEGYLAVGDTVLVDSARGRFTPPHERRLAVLGQEPLLFPHLRVQANVEFGPRSQGRSREEARRRATHLLEEVDAARFSRRFPAQLSGGQAARVALARALASQPRAVLLDEPFAALDVHAAPQMRRVLGAELRRSSVPAVLVTHDLLDVLALADDLAVIENGRIVECAPTAEVLRAPSSAFAAGLAGVNHVRGRTEGETCCGPNRVSRSVASATKRWGPTRRPSPCGPPRPSRSTPSHPRAARETCGRGSSRTSPTVGE
ncbi:ATP-binding cassette domain-containing protein [Mobilicoccus caccae]|uniref:ABC transporter domain-containing protein n=1 Tax=Mobilicoccus caccae TaxID=1859295 RepID=A0ABQ6ITY4_9MICO|nr:ATP-binding cassette domain-containing protein [Mobilicoccus caccae]GMA40939.1 hypothetical protein GCM10025883_29840 [Mobilicoccus caccae]